MIFVFQIYVENKIRGDLVHVTEKHVSNIKMVSIVAHYNDLDDHHYEYIGLSAHASCKP